ncbi:hypothetical protein M409DRAFT_48482 [Zasmidium cellare ATCC 36951]|uniref:Uncharacterized protein n=1 Tax=Zasmidium cellare ATCC 36951 TaxID=1080233 RepID=A0A6A6D289_ZASCE|nr:uncharacterized protein M409DRAFT_48482 [Zasmidium cellare ATCC 36951]KAF2173517.1 hypothetical protein M409DRAFT_48482 [Zasmidium cellare ATCC 36951]
MAFSSADIQTLRELYRCNRPKSNSCRITAVPIRQHGTQAKAQQHRSDDTPKTPVKTKNATNTKDFKAKEANSPEPPPAPKKRAAEGLWFRKDENNELAVIGAEESVAEQAIDYYADDSDDSDYVDDSDAEIVDSVPDGKCDYGDLEEEGDIYVILLKSGDFVKEEEHEAQDPEHKTCVLDVKEDHVVKQH